MAELDDAKPVPAGDIRPFRLDVSDDVLDDLRARLNNTRWPDTETVDDWSQGTPLAYLREVCHHWGDPGRYRWREREAAINRFDQFITEIDGLDIHFVHQRSPHDEALPLIITHGWPGSIVEFHKVIEPLSDPTRFGGDAADAFHVVAPSLPGFAFSGKPTEPGWGVERIGGVWAELMACFGYDRYVAKGGDWGSAVTSHLAGTDPDHCAAIHLTMAMSARPTGAPSTSEEHEAIARIEYYRDHDSGYAGQQQTRPQTVGYGLHDSPAGQAAWILEKFWAWTDCDGHPENVLTRDELLDNIMLYWVDRLGHVFGPDLLGELRPVDATDGHRAHGVLRVSGRDRAAGAALGRSQVSEHRVLEEARPRRALPVIGGARSVRGRHPRLFPTLSVTPTR